MRPTYRAAGLLALAVVAITCTDAPTGPGGHRPGFAAGRLAMAPSFSPTATRAFNVLEAMGIGVTQVRIRLRAADGTVVRDTTIQYGTRDTLHIQISVEIRGTEQTFRALIELMDAGGMVLFAQTQDVTAHAAPLSAAPPPTIALEYVGPGASARAITITPAGATVPPGVEPVLTAVGIDAAGNPVTDLLLAWTSSDATLATVTADGRVATVHGTGRRGTATITATMPTGLAGSAQLTMLSLATRLAATSGDAQVDSVGAALALPFTVRATDEFGATVPDASIAWERLAGLGTLGATTTTTDAEGLSRTTYLLGLVPGADTVRATLTGATGTAATLLFTAKAIARGAGPAARFGLVQPAPKSITVGVVPPAPVKARLDDANGNAVNTPGVLVTATLTLPPATAPAYVVSALTDGAGVATLVLPAYAGTIGSAVLIITADGLSSSVSEPIAIVAGAPALLRLIPPPESSALVAVSGTPFAPSPVVQVTDVGANPLPAAGIGVSVTLGGGTATLATAPSVSTDVNGRAAFDSLIITGVPGPVSLLFSAQSLAPASLELALAANIAGLTVIPANGTEFSAIVPAGSLSQAIAVNVLNAKREPVPGAQLLLAIPFTGGCTFAGGGTTLTVDTDASGLAGFNVDLSPLAATNGGGCTVWARSGINGIAQSESVQQIYRIAVAPTPEHRIWWGDATATGGDWTLPANWRRPSSPGPGEKVFVPMWSGGVQLLTLDSDLEIGEIAVDQLTQVLVNATLRVTDAVIGAPTSSIAGTGRIMTTGDGTIVAAPNLTRLVIGETTACLTRATTLTGPVFMSDSLTVNCPLAIAGTVTVGGSLATANRGRIEISATSSQLHTRGDATFGGDSLIVANGSLVVDGMASFAGRGGQLSGGIVQVAGDVKFGGSGTGGYALTGGQLRLDGAFTQTRSDTASTFIASSEHLTIFTGSVMQQVTFEDANASHFARVSFANRGAGVRIPAASFASAIVAADVQPGTLLTIDGTFTGATLRLLGGATLTVNGTLASGCSGATLLPTPIVSGDGRIGPDLLPAVVASCGP